MSNYWSGVLRKRVSRRRALAGASASTAGALFLAACGGDDDDEGASPTTTGTTPSAATGATGTATGATGTTGGASTGATGGTSGSSALVREAADTSDIAVRGGTLNIAGTFGDPPHLDAISGAFRALSAIAPFTLGRLLELDPGRLTPFDGSVMPGIAESWEFSGDGTEMMLKLRRGVRFHSIDPVNGRELDMEDVVFSWDRSVELGQLGSQVQSINPNAPILGLETPDSETMVIKLAEPLVYLPSLLAGANSGRVQMMPKEADGGYDPRQQLIGTGPFYLSDYQPSIGMTFTAHPEYWRSELPYADSINYPSVEEYSTGLSQFKAGALHTFDVAANDLLSIKEEEPSLDIYQGEVAPNTIQQQFGFEPGSPFLDERVRQAVSMSFDRDLWISVVFNTDLLEGAGLPVETRWNSAVPANIYEGWWLDPQSDAFGENAKYYQFNLEEAKALLSAAGYPDGLDVVSNHFTSGQFGADYPSLIEISEGMLAQAGFRIEKNIYVYEQEHADVYRDAKGRFDGYTYRLGPGALSPDPVAQMLFNYGVSGRGFYGFDAAGTGDGSGDPFIEDLLLRARQEQDTETRREMVFEAQRHLGKAQYCVRWPGGASEFRMASPEVMNFNVFRGVGANEYPYLWIDQG